MNKLIIFIWVVWTVASRRKQRKDKKELAKPASQQTEHVEPAGSDPLDIDPETLQMQYPIDDSTSTKKNLKQQLDEQLDYQVKLILSLYRQTYLPLYIEIRKNRKLSLLVFMFFLHYLFKLLAILFGSSRKSIKQKKKYLQLKSKQQQEDIELVNSQLNALKHELQQYLNRNQPQQLNGSIGCDAKEVEQMLGQIQSQDQIVTKLKERINKFNNLSISFQNSIIEFQKESFNEIKYLKSSMLQNSGTFQEDKKDYRTRKAPQF